MAAGSNKVGTLGDALLIFYETRKRLVTHAVETRAHIVGSPVRREDGYTFQAGTFVKSVDVVYTHIVVQLVCLSLIAFRHKSRGVASRSCTNVEQERVWLDEAAQVMHGGFKLYDAVPALQAKVFGVLIVIYVVSSNNNNSQQR